MPAEVRKAVARSPPELLLSMYKLLPWGRRFLLPLEGDEACVDWQGKGPADAPSSQRPLCMLDTAGKLLENLVRPRLQASIKAAGDLSDRQYGFWMDRFTVDSLQEIVRAAKSAKRGNHYSRPVCLLATLDVKNAFNSVRWVDALQTLRRDLQRLQYLLGPIADYLKDRFIVYDTENGPDICNASYDGNLRIEMPYGCFLIGYADDVAASSPEGM